MSSLIDQLFAVISRQSGLTAVPFNEGCSQEQIRQLESTLGLALPDDYRALLRHRNGQSDPHALSFPPDQLVFLSDTAVTSMWQELQAYQDDQFFDEVQDEDRVRAVLYHPKRIPIAHNEAATAYLCLDFIPGPTGAMGQLVFNINEADCVVVEKTVRDLFGRYLKLLEGGHAKVEAKPKGVGHGYWFAAAGRPIDWATYKELKTRV